jgi:hypothetical protein
MSWRKHMLLATVSGASAWPLNYALEWLDSTGLPGAWAENSYIFVGAIFGALVLVPFVSDRRRRTGAIVALVLGSVAVYGLVVEFATKQYGPLKLDYDVAIVVSGLLGAVLVGLLAKIAVPLKTPGIFWVAVSAAGLSGGFLFSLVWESDYDAIAATGFIGWQVLVCLALVSAATYSNALQVPQNG